MLQACKYFILLRCVRNKKRQTFSKPHVAIRELCVMRSESGVGVLVCKLFLNAKLFQKPILINKKVSPIQKYNTYTTTKNR